MRKSRYVALAAVMGACALAGGVGRAEAATLTFDRRIQLGGVEDDGYYLIHLDYNSDTGTSDGFAINNDYFNNYGVTDVFSDRVTNVSVSGRGPNYSVVIDIALAFGLEPLTSFSGGLQSESQWGEISFEPGSPYYSGGYDFYSESVGSGFPISGVPLPSSAPLLGAALLALGGLSYARRRGAVNGGARSATPT